MPLWYAHYDHLPTFADWDDYGPEEIYVGPFGGWDRPTGKQYDSNWSVSSEKMALCDSVAVDWDIMEVPDAGEDDDTTGSPPPPPTGLHPNGGTIDAASVELGCDPIDDALEYEFVMEYQSGGWTDYETSSSTTNSKIFSLQHDNTGYRWKVRARNQHGWGDFSGWAAFDYEAPVTGEPPPAPTRLQPDAQGVTTSPVTLSCDAIDGVTDYEFEIYYRSNDQWVYYYTYSSNTNSQTFWPQIPNTSYRWLVRAHNQHGWGPWSYDAVFWFFPAM
jgi:hypothetical protein